MKTAISLIVLVSMLLVSTACEKQEGPDNNIIINPNPDPAQYGTPFQGVPDTRDVVIYQVNMRAFSNTRNFKGVITRLDSIKD